MLHDDLPVICIAGGLSMCQCSHSCSSAQGDLAIEREVVKLPHLHDSVQELRRHLHVTYRRVVSIRRAHLTWSYRPLDVYTCGSRLQEHN